jgi:hypothetical protein
VHIRNIGELIDEYQDGRDMCGSIADDRRPALLRIQNGPGSKVFEEAREAAES